MTDYPGYVVGKCIIKYYLQKVTVRIGEKCKEMNSFDLVWHLVVNLCIKMFFILLSTAQGIIQTCNATLKLVKTLMDKIGLSPFYTARLQKRALWTQMVEHSLFREKIK